MSSAKKSGSGSTKKSKRSAKKKPDSATNSDSETITAEEFFRDIDALTQTASGRATQVTVDTLSNCNPNRFLNPSASSKKLPEPIDDPPSLEIHGGWLFPRSTYINVNPDDRSFTNKSTCDEIFGPQEPTKYEPLRIKNVPIYRNFDVQYCCPCRVPRCCNCCCCCCCCCCRYSVMNQYQPPERFRARKNSKKKICNKDMKKKSNSKDVAKKSSSKKVSTPKQASRRSQRSRRFSIKRFLTLDDLDKALRRKAEEEEAKMASEMVNTEVHGFIEALNANFDLKKSNENDSKR